MKRRDFLKLSALAASTPLARLSAQAPPPPDHFIPARKNLSDAWKNALFAPGGSAVYSKDDLKTIAMPVGGICCGQLYLTGEGRFAYWDLFNIGKFSGYGADNYALARTPSSPVDHGFCVKIATSAGTSVHSLDSAGFKNVTFCGEYPFAWIDYSSDRVPVKVRLEAFSPFIPLNAPDSALPATIMRFSVTNTSSGDLDVTLAGWLQNAVCIHTGGNFTGDIFNKLEKHPNARTLSCHAAPAPETAQTPPPTVFADFDGDNYGDWTVEGDAFGAGPAHGTLDKQQEVTGYLGKGLVNTYLGGDDRKTGKLISPEFTIERRFISFLIGGGNHKDKTCLNLVVDGKVVQTAVGKSEERLLWQNFNVSGLRGKKAHIEIVDAETQGWGHINIDQIEFGDTARTGTAGKLVDQHDFGTMALSVLDTDNVVSSLSLPSSAMPANLFADDGLAQDSPVRKPFGDRLRGAIGKELTLKAGATGQVSFVLSWCFPNRYTMDQRVGNFYAKRFSSASDVAAYVADNFEDLAGKTRLWHRTYYDSTLPHWLLDRLHSTVSTLATETCQWWNNGRFWAWEGVGCCHGTCAHVWNYEHAMARLFPQLERSVRLMQDYDPQEGFDEPTGMVRFRGRGWNMWAADGQAGTVLKAYREHQVSTDGAFLKDNWQRIRKSLQFLIDQDSNSDGILEGQQHNTFDIDFYGANPMIGSLYLGALRAGEEMANEVGDNDFAATCRKIFAGGLEYTQKHLFNGEYFIQKVDLEKHPENQYGDGCLSDQVFGQGWAFQTALGYVYPEEMTKSAIRSIWKYNWAPDVAPQNKIHPPERWFARPGEAGLFTCTWPKGKHMGPKSVRYRDEIWTGIEYQVAGHMAWEGMTTEALAICRGVHERYHPSKHNPFNEIECGDHYARALASWGVLLGLCGFEYHGPKGYLGFAPRMTPDDFKAVFTGSEGWGSISQKRSDTAQVNTVEVKWGSLKLKKLQLEVPDGVKAKKVRAVLDGKELRSSMKQASNVISVEIPKGVTLEAGQKITVDTDY